MNRKTYKRKNNKNGFTILLILIVLLVIVFWRLTSGSNYLIFVAGEQRKEMNKNEIKIDMSEIPEFELN